MEQVLQKAANLKINRMVLVVPWWVTKPFFATLQVFSLPKENLVGYIMLL